MVTIQLLQGLGLEGATQVPYDSGADAITAIMGNHVDVSFMQVGDLGSARGIRQCETPADCGRKAL